MQVRARIPISLDFSVVVSQTTGPRDIPHRRGSESGTGPGDSAIRKDSGTSRPLTNSAPIYSGTKFDPYKLGPQPKYGSGGWLFSLYMRIIG